MTLLANLTFSIGTSIAFLFTGITGVPSSSTANKTKEDKGCPITVPAPGEEGQANHYFVWNPALNQWEEVSGPSEQPNCNNEPGENCSATSDEITPEGQPTGDDVQIKTRSLG